MSYRGPLETASCLICGASFERPKSCSGGPGNGATLRRFCSRPCILAGVGLPADFDPGLFVSEGGRILQDVSPAAQASIKATLDAALAARAQEVRT